MEGLLQGLACVAKETSEELGPGASQEQLVSRAVKVNVFNSMNFLLKFIWLRIFLFVFTEWCITGITCCKFIDHVYICAIFVVDEHKQTMNSGRRKLFEGV